MKRLVVRIVEVLVLPTLGLVAGLTLAPGRGELIAHVYIVVVLAGCLGVLVAAIAAAQPDAGPSLLERGLRVPPRPAVERLGELARIETDVTLGQATAFDLHYRLRPTMQLIAGGLLAARRGIDLDRQPERARAALGAETWELVRPDREPPADRNAPGIEREALRRAVASLEEMSA